MPVSGAKKTLPANSNRTITAKGYNMYYASIIDQSGNLLMEVTSRDELTHFHQHLMAMLHETKTRLYCCCRDRHSPEMHIAKFGTKFVLRLNPTSYRHDEYCPLWFVNRNLDDHDTGFSPGIFIEYDALGQKCFGRGTHPHPASGFYRFGVKLFAMAQSYALNACNKKECSSWKTFDIGTFFYCLDSIFRKNKDLMKNGLTVYQSLPSDIAISGGILESLEQESMVVCEDWLIHGSMSRQIRLFDPKRIVERLTKKKSIFGYCIKGPYLYLAVFKKNDRKLVKMFVYPIAIRKSNFVFCDSDKEREFAESILGNDSIIFKPLSQTDDYYKLGKFFFLGKRPHLRYSIDFVVLESPGRMTIVEVCGFPTDVNYMHRLRQKEQYYLSLLPKHRGLRYVRR
ncbi:hypothetical protein [Hydrogenimonas sp.]